MQTINANVRKKAEESYDSPLDVFAYVSKNAEKDMAATVRMFRKAPQRQDENATSRVVAHA